MEHMLNGNRQPFVNSHIILNTVKWNLFLEVFGI